ncbi:hypothetical protein FQZ97_638710 [compost metagenome]
MRFVDAFVGQALAQCFGQVLRQEAGLLAAHFQGGAEAHAGALQETLHIGLGAQGVLLFMPLWQHLVGLDAALGKDGAVGFGFLQGVLPLGLQWRQQLLGFTEIETGLRRCHAAAAAPHERGLDQGLVDAGFVLREGHQHAQFLLDGFALAQDDVEHKTIDRVVLPVEHGATDFVGLLAKTVNAAFALLMACRVPGQIVMDDGGEQMLQVDAFGKTVGGDQDALLGILQVFHALPAFFGCEFAGDGIDSGLGESGLEVFGHVMGGGDVAAEHHRVVAILHQKVNMPDEHSQLWITRLAGKT